MNNNTNERFPCSDEHVPKPKRNYAKEIVDSINEMNRNLYGPMCKKCDCYEAWCRCKNKSVFKDTQKE